MPDNSPDSTTNDVNALLQLPDDAFAREIGLKFPGAEEGSQEEVVKEVVEEVVDGEGETPEAPEGAEEIPEADEKDEKDDKGDEDEADKPKSEKPELKLATQFTAVDEEGVEYDLGELAKVKINFKANGKERTESLDKVVRLAQFGFHNEEVQKERDFLRGKALPELTAERDEFKERFEDANALALKLLQDPDFYVETREQMAARLTPEARAEAAERKLAEKEQQETKRSIAQESVQFTSQHIMPKLQALQTEYPSVTEEEIVGMFTIATAPYTRNGVVPKEAWPRVAQMVDGEIASRMALLHEQRVAGKTVDAQRTAAKVTKAREETTKAKRTLARAIKAPSASGRTPASKPKVAKPITSAEDAIDSIIGDIEGSFRT